MKKTLLALSISFAGLNLLAQPRCFIVGPAYNMGSTSISAFSFTRTYSTMGTDGPTTEFSNLGDAQTKNSAAGLYTDIYLKRSRISLDLMFPFKNSGANVINFNLAFGGYIKGKVGILAGLSLYQNTKELGLYPADASVYSELTLKSEVNSSGNFYNSSNYAGGGGVNLLLTYAHDEKLVFRVDYGFYMGGITHKKSGEPETYDWNQSSNRKLEIGAVWQFHESFGLAAKFFTWTTTGTYTAEIEYDGQAGETLSKEIAIFPERTYKSTNFTISLMIPLGSAEYQGGSVDVK